MSKFLKVDGVVLLNGGYLSAKEGESPVTNDEFVAAQRQAEYVCTFAKLAEGKDFEGKEADSLADLKAAVNAKLATKATVFVKAPKKVVKKLADQIAAEAMDFMSWGEESSKVEKMNAFLQQFEVLNDFEAHGLFFSDGIVKLNKIYTMDEVIKAVESTISLLND